jgi:hypothetical protein
MVTWLTPAGTVKVCSDPVALNVQVTTDVPVVHDGDTVARAAGAVTIPNDTIPPPRPTTDAMIPTRRRPAAFNPRARPKIPMPFIAVTLSPHPDE